MFNEYCKKKMEIGLTLCDRINRKVPNDFCRISCNGNAKEFIRETNTEMRKRLTKSLTEQQLSNTELVSVIIAVGGFDLQYLERTVASLRETAVGPIEIFVGYDGCPTMFIVGTQPKLYPTPVGQRKIMNDAAKVAEGEYIFKIDAHCSMSHGWDARMKESAADDCLVNCVVDILDEKTWQGKGHSMGHAVINSNMKAEWVRLRNPSKAVVEEQMTGCGCGWMLKAPLFDTIGGCNEEMGPYGAIGPEMALRFWSCWGYVVLRNDVVCNHLFRKGKQPFVIDDRDRPYRILKEEYSEYRDLLAKKFANYYKESLYAVV